jgi:hypothetical protein
MTALCACGCGLPAPISTYTQAKRGYMKGQPRKYRAGHYAKNRATTDKYRHSYQRGRGKFGHVLTHILIAETALGHRLPKGTEVHHVDGNSTNNERTNLVICQDRKYHHLLHARARIVANGGDPNTQRFCGDCRSPKAFSEFSPSKSDSAYGLQSVCKLCARVRSADRRLRLSAS